MNAAVARLSVVALLATVLTALPSADAQAAPADLVPPEHITVCRSSGAIETVTLKDYVKTVLPREFPSSWPIETIKAGAVAVKSYAWYHVERPWKPGTCHISDTTRHQKYAPEDTANPPTSKTNAAVEETWHWRMEEDGQVAYAQYCNCYHFPVGRHIQQEEARDLAAQGWDHVQILRHSYRAMSNWRLLDWRVGFGMAYQGAQPYAIEADRDLTIRVGIAGVRPGDPAAVVDLLAICTIGTTYGFHPVQRVGVSNVDGRAVAVFDATGRLHDCVEDQVLVRVELIVRGTKLLHGDAPAWKPWTSATPRDVERIAASNDPSTASVALSQRVFDERQHAAQTMGGTPLTDAAQAEQPDAVRRQARAVVLARSDAFPDSLSATALAGVDAPILLNPGGADATLRDDVRAEIDRVLEPADTVHIVGGPAAISASIEHELSEAGYLVRRHGGETRIATALAVADAMREGSGDTSTVVLARAYGPGSAGWADAVAGGPWAAAMRHPVLLTADDHLAPDVEAWVEANEVEEVVVLGGPQAVPLESERELDVTVTRVAGASRSLTATAIADELWTRSDAPDVTGAMLVDGYDAGDWPFALAAAVYAANEGMPQLLTTRLVPNGSTGAWLDGRPQLSVSVVGGDEVVPPRIEQDASGPTG